MSYYVKAKPTLKSKVVIRNKDLKNLEWLSKEEDRSIESIISDALKFYINYHH